MIEPPAQDHVPENALDVPLHDDEQLSEVELLTDLMIAGVESREGLREDEVDNILGLYQGP